jgi:hypothetical protein
VVSAAVHVPRKRWERAWTGTSHSAEGGEPLRAVWGWGATRHASMDRRRRGQCPGPGVQDPDQTDLASAVVRIQGAGFQGSGGGLQEEGGDAGLVRAGCGPQCFGQRQGDEKRRDRQAQDALLFQPARGLVVLARGTMPMRAGMLTVLQVTARRTLGAMTAQSLCPALCDGRHGLQVAGGHMVGACGAGRRSIAPEDIGACEHGRPPVDMSILPCVPAAHRAPGLQL